MKKKITSKKENNKNTHKTSIDENVYQLMHITRSQINAGYMCIKTLRQWKYHQGIVVVSAIQPEKAQLLKPGRGPPR